jgi:hypothetical protein
MSKRCAPVLAAAASAVLAGCVTLPPPWQLGGGVSRAAVSTNYSALGEQSSDGVAVVASWEFVDLWWLDLFGSIGHRLETGATQNIYYPPDHAEYGAFVAGVRRDFWSLDERRWTPWILGGLGVADVFWDTYAYEVAGGGLVLGAGVDARLGDSPASLRAQVLRHEASGEDSYGYGPYDLTGTIGSLLLVWTFGDQDDAGH